MMGVVLDFFNTIVLQRLHSKLFLIAIFATKVHIQIFLAFYSDESLVSIYVIQHFHED